MIEVQELDRPGTLARAGSALVSIMRAEAEVLALAAHWADLHDPASLPPVETEFEARRRRFEQQYGVQPGGEGTPEVLVSCFAELGLVLQTSAGAAKHLVADALDLRHRLPRLWDEVQSGRVRKWKACKVAQATRLLPSAAMAEVDAGLAGLLTALPWSRFEAVLEATVLRADPVGAAHAEAEAASRRFVSLGRDGGPGLKTLIARGEVLDILTFLAAVNRVADCLAAEGDPDTVEVRRSKAVGILGQPDRALSLLAAHVHDEDAPPFPVEPRQRGGWRRPGTLDERVEPEEADGSDERDELREPHNSEERPEPRDEDEAAAASEAEPGGSNQPGRRSLDLSGSVGQLPGRASSSIRVQLYVHLTDAALNGTDPAAVARVEGVGPVTAATVRGWLRRSDVKITVRPVVVPGDAVPVDGYEIPHSVRQAVLLRNPASAFPWSWCTDRHSLQLDHVRAYLARARGGPPGQTRPANLAPLVGTEHQPKTSGHWQERTPVPGVYLWRSPHGWITLVTNQGTFPLGSGATAHRIWRAAAPVETMAQAA